MKTVSILLLITFTNGERTKWKPKTPKENFYEVTSPKGKFDENIGPPPQPIPVFLSPFIRDGMLDPATGLKTPVDVLEWKMKYPRNEEERRKYMKTSKLTQIQFIQRPSPRPKFDSIDEILAEIQNKTNERPEPMWFNYETIQNMNLNQRPMAKEPPLKYQSLRPNLPHDLKNIDQVKKFRGDTFMLYQRDNSTNWTTCDEFKRNSKFHPKDVIGVEWLPFYLWSDMLSEYNSAVIHKFNHAPLKLVNRIKKELGSRLSYNVDWQQPKLMMDGTVKHLLIAVDQSGLFYNIRDVPLPDYFKRNKALKYPVNILSLKIVGRYLAMMACDAFYAIIMAPKNDVPKTDEGKAEKAKILKFRGPGYPISRDLERERMDAETRRKLLEHEEERKFIKIRDHGFTVNDRQLDLWVYK